jgi:hypothetical protein
MKPSPTVTRAEAPRRRGAGRRHGAGRDPAQRGAQPRRVREWRRPRGADRRSAASGYEQHQDRDADDREGRTRPRRRRLQSPPETGADPTAQASTPKATSGPSAAPTVVQRPVHAERAAERGGHWVAAGDHGVARRGAQAPLPRRSAVMTALIPVRPCTGTRASRLAARERVPGGATHFGRPSRSPATRRAVARTRSRPGRDRPRNRKRAPEADLRGGEVLERQHRVDHLRGDVG